MAHQCLNQTTFAAVGGHYPRNIFFEKETRNYFFCMQSILLLDLMNTMFPIGSLNHKIVLSIFAIYLPVKHYLHSKQNFPEIFHKENKSTMKEFHMTKSTVLIPRHPCTLATFSWQPSNIMKLIAMNLFHSKRPPVWGNQGSLLG